MSLLKVPLTLLLSACTATSEMNDWQQRIGQYALEDAKRDLGFPESCVGLDDGGTACSWRMKSAAKVARLILTFGPTGQLATVNDVQF
ncbi:MAG TPA: hypothetical protein VFM05_09825 [Candidatus Saccharimonadales bacterium]|nr:hypothetical protein [Candidatus Saccharimonadales bacterium]